MVYNKCAVTSIIGQVAEMLKMQQETIDSMLSMRSMTPERSVDGGESSGYESSGGTGASAMDMRKLELAVQRLGQKMTSHVK